MLKLKRTPIIAAAAATVVVLAVVGWTVMRTSAPAGNVADGGDPYIESMRVVSSDQYINIVRDVFGPMIEVEGRFVSHGQRKDGLLAVGSAQASVSSVGFEIAEEMAHKIASQIVSERHRAELIPCQPGSGSTFDMTCAQQFIGEVGRLLYRRPMTETELARQLQAAQSVAQQGGDFYAGLERSLVNMLISPKFLLRVERSEPDPDHRHQYRLTSYAKASRLSFLLWNSTPDKALLNAAERGELHMQSGLKKQVDRLMASPRLERGVRAFFADMLELEQIETLTKDLTLFPKFSYQVSQEIPEQTLRTIVDHLLVRDGDYRELFTTRHTFLTPNLAALLAIPMVQQTANAEPDRWLPYTFPKGDPRSGILTHPSFVALHAHPGQSSPTLRGKALRENLLCQEVPDPPPAVDFNLVQDTTNPLYKTMRQRLSAHATAPTCAGCHKITDPIGLALETFDADGSYRTRENGEPIDTSGEVDGMAYADTVGMSQAISRNPSLVSCLVNRVYAYGTGREIAPRDRKWLKEARKDFVKNGHRLTDLLRRIGTSDVFYQGDALEPQTVAQR